MSPGVDLSGGIIATLLRRWIVDVTSPPAAHLLAEAAEHSYRHANGFAKITLPGFGPTRERLRLHIWDREARLVDPDPHNHRWPFVSRVLVGRIEDRHYVVRDGAGTEYVHHRHQQTGVERGYRFTRVGVVELQLAHASFVGCGAEHRLEPDTIHAPVAGDGAYAATLVLESEPIRTFSDVYSRSNKPMDVELDPPRFDVAEVGRMLGDLASRMAEG
jgi:hypothetical protein